MGGSVPWVAVTGFGPFLDVEENPSERLARALEARPPAGLGVRARILPVTVDGSAADYEAWATEWDEAPLALLSMGVHNKPGFRLERQARGRLSSTKPDTAGRVPDGVELGEDRRTGLDLEALAGALRAAGSEDAWISEDAGGYICERVYHHVLGRAAELGVPGFFLHVPPLPELGADAKIRHLEAQADCVRALLVELARQA